MRWIENMLSHVSPRWATQREIDRRNYERLKRLPDPKDYMRSIVGIGGGRTRYDILTTSKSANAEIENNIETLKGHVRQMELNTGFVAGPIKRIAKAVVGRGITFQSRVKESGPYDPEPRIGRADAERWNHLAELWWPEWVKQADKRLISTFYEQQLIVEAQLVRDNESVVVGRISRRKDRIIPYCLDVFEADRLQTPLEEAKNPGIRNGIRYDEEGVPSSYFLLKKHPGDTFTPAALSKGQDFEEVPAFNENGTRKVFHLFNPWRPEQTRGFTEFTAGLRDLQDLDRYMEAEKMRKLEAACLTGVVTTQNPTGWAGGLTSSSGDLAYDRIHEFAPNKWYHLRPGEKAEILDPHTDGAAFRDVIDQLVRGPANSLDIPPEVYSQDWRGLNYSNARTILLQLYAHCIYRQAYLISHLCIPVWENVARWFLIMGKLRAFGFERRQEAWLRSAWIPSVYRKWVDPKKESEGRKIDVESVFDTLTDTAAENGRDFDEMAETRARELAKIKALEQLYEVSFTPAKGEESPAGGEGESEDADSGDGDGKEGRGRSFLSLVRT